MKCDEIKPRCGQCVKASRECVYGNASAGGNNVRSIGSSEEQVASQGLARAYQQVHNSPQQSSDLTYAPEGTDSGSPLMQARQTAPSTREVHSPQSTYSASTAYGVDVAPLRWYSLLAGDAATETRNTPRFGNLSDVQAAPRFEAYSGGIFTSERPPHDSAATQHSHSAVQHSSSRSLDFNAAPLESAASSVDERRLWQCAHPLELDDHELDIFEGFVNGVSLWLDLFDPKQNFSTYVPHLALHNGSCDCPCLSMVVPRGEEISDIVLEGLMKAILALGSRHLSIKQMHNEEVRGSCLLPLYYYITADESIRNEGFVLQNTLSGLTWCIPASDLSDLIID